MKNSLLFFALLLCACNGGSNEEHKDSQAQVPSEDTVVVKKDGFDFGNFQKLVEQYEDPQRANWQNPELIIDKLSPLKNKTVADIGAGTGYFTFRMAEKGAKVIAIDIDDRFLEYIDNRQSELSDVIPAQQITTRLSEENDPLLQKAEVDLALLVNTYHFLENRPDYLNKIAEGLKANGRLVIVDYKEEQMPVGPAAEDKISLDQVRLEIEKASLEILEVDSKSLNYQYIITAKKK